MATLEFKGKQFVYAHHLTVPFRPLVIDEKLSLPPKGEKPTLDNNLIIHADNLHGLKALLPTLAGKIKCGFIDPPYNTGEEKWCYNDNVNSPLMREWLRKAAPVDKEDLERHEKWLCMMWPRLKLIHELLREDGVLWVTLDDNEVLHARLILDEIFQPENFVACVIWQHSIQPKGYTGRFSVHHNYILCYQRSAAFQLGDIERTEEHNKNYSNPDGDPNGKWRPGDVRNALDRENLKYDIPTPSGKVIHPPPKGWRWSWDTVQRKIKTGEILFSKDETRIIRKIYLKTVEGRAPETIWFGKEVGTTRDAAEELKEMFGQPPLETAKPVGLIEKIIQISTDEEDVVLDSFAGTAPTGHAVLRLNGRTGWNRRFILVECEDYADRTTAQRVRLAIRGYKFEGTKKEELYKRPVTFSTFKDTADVLGSIEGIENLEGHRFDRITKKIENDTLTVTGEKKITEKVEGLGGSFTFCTLGDEITMDGLLSGKKMPDYESLAKYVFYTATSQTLAKVPKPKADWFIAETANYRVHLIYRPDRDWLRSNEAMLDAPTVEKITAGLDKQHKALVFAPAKFMSQRELTPRRVEFCQLPYAIYRILGD